MEYIIADPDMQNGAELKKILDGFEKLDFQGCYTTLQTAENGVRKKPPDIAFIRMGKAELNAFLLAAVIREQNPFSKVIFVGNQKENAIEAFEHEANGFLLMPFNKEKIRQWLQLNLGKRG